MKSHARVVIVGGGVVGVSTAWHMTRLGWRDVVVLDQGPLFNNLGSTSHAPGLMYEHNASKTMTTLAMWSVDTYVQARPIAEQVAYQVGSMEIATTPERYQELKRRVGQSMSWGLPAELIGPDDIARLVPVMRADDLYGAFYVPRDLAVKTVPLLEALAREAAAAGAAFHPNTEVTGIEVKNGRVRAVETARGRIETEIVVCAAGLWGPLIGRMVGVPIPLSPYQHIFTRTGPVLALAGETEWIRHPFVRDQDKDMYYRQYADRYGFGSYRHEPMLVPCEELPRNDRPAIFPYTPERFAESLADVAHRAPALAAAGLEGSFNGLFSFTPDGYPVLGEWPDVRGFWSAEAVWVTHGGGVGKVMAEWIVAGHPSIDLRECDITRFHPHHRTRPYIRARGRWQYFAVYDVIHPLQQMDSPRLLRLTPFHQRLKDLGAVFFENAGWERPQWLEANVDLPDDPAWPERNAWTGRWWSPTVGQEHRAVRERAAMFDITPFAKIEITGPGAFDFLQRHAANRISQRVGRVVYTAFLDERGMIQLDVTIVKLAEERYWLLTGGAFGLRDLAWLRKHAPDDCSVHLANVSSAYATIGLWGPRARDVLRPVVQEDVSNEAFPYFHARELTIGYAPVLALRVSYVGELGWEIYTPTEYGPHVWDTLWKAGQSHGLIVAGGGAFESLRMEKGYRMWGNEIHTEYNPLEAGLGFAVDWKKGDFLGRAALEKIRTDGPKKKLCCLTIDDPRVILMGKEPILSDGAVVGYVTSASYGYTVKQSIAYGYLPVPLAAVGRTLEIQFFGRLCRATVAREPLFDPEMARLKA